MLGLLTFKLLCLLFPPCKVAHSKIFSKPTGAKLFFLIFGVSLSYAAFMEPSAFIQKYSLTETISEFVVSVNVTDSKNGTMHCSGAFVSDRGHLLIASHCLEAAVSRDSQNGEFYARQLEVNGRVQDWKVILLSPCRAKSVQDWAGEIPSCSFFDLALLEPTSNPFHSDKHSCATILEEFDPGAPLGALGFPSRTMRLRGGNSDGVSFYASEGRAVDSPFCTITNSPMRFRIGEQIFLPEAILQAKNEHAVQMDMDVVAGNSGGPIFDLKKRGIVGVVSFSSLEGGFDPRSEECSGGISFFAPSLNLEKAYSIWNRAIGGVSRPWAEVKSEMQCHERNFEK